MGLAAAAMPGDLPGPGLEYGFAAATRACSVSYASDADTAPEAHLVISQRPARKHRSTTARDPWCGIPKPQVPAHAPFRLDAGHSRKSVRLLSFRSSSRIWAELHEQAFRRLGGATRLVVLDNLAEGVVMADFYDPALNPLYATSSRITARWRCRAASRS